MIRLFGFLMVYGSVGTLEVDPYAPLLPSCCVRLLVCRYCVNVLDGMPIVWRRRINSESD